MEIVKTPSEFGHKDIRIVESEDKHLDIVFGGTGDIYWIYDNQEEFFTEEDPMYDSFAIPARDEGLYAIFEELYNDLINGNIDYVIIDAAPAHCITEAINAVQ